MSALIPPNPPGHPKSDNTCTKEHCFYAFDTLYCNLTKAKPIPPTFPDEKYPLFVTWNIKRGREYRLRGCIGNFSPMPLHEGISEYALISALRDTRFNPISRSDLERLQCCVSLLTNFEPGASYLDWTVGVHGIYITFAHPATLAQDATSEAPSPYASAASLPSVASKRTFTATYLPDVIPEQGWDKVEAVDSAIAKAGWQGRITEDLRRSIALERYQSSKCEVTWEEYMEWRKQRLGVS